MPRITKASQILKVLPAIVLAYALFHTETVTAKPMFFRQAMDTEFPMGPQGHLMDLKGAWSLASSLSADQKQDGLAALVYGVIPFSSNPESTLHGYYILPSYFYTKGKEAGEVLYPGNHGWQVAAGRGNLDFPHSIFRGFLQMAYRDMSLNDDPDTNSLEATLPINKNGEKKRSVIISTGVSSTQNSLVSQHKPFLDTELLLTLRYDYEKGDFFSNVRASLFYPSWVETGAFVQWFKVFRENKNPNYEEVADDFIFGPRLRGRAWNHLAFDISLDWHMYRDFNGRICLPTPRGQASAILNF